MFPKPSLSTLLLTANLVTLSCDPVLVDFDSLCYTPFIDTLDATPAEAYASDTTTMTASIYTPCVSSTYATVTFPEESSLDITEFPDYDASLDAVLLTQTTDKNPLNYSSSPLPLTSFSSGDILYRITAVSGYPSEDHSATLDKFFRILSDDTAYTADTGGFSKDTLDTGYTTE